jgi:hypothetical protein
VKIKRPRRQLSNQQYMILGLLLVILLAVSLLYCLGFASLALLQAWEDAALPWDETQAVDGSILPTPAIGTPTAIAP